MEGKKISLKQDAVACVMGCIAVLLTEAVLHTGGIQNGLVVVGSGVIVGCYVYLHVRKE